METLTQGKYMYSNPLHQYEYDEQDIEEMRVWLKTEYPDVYLDVIHKWDSCTAIAIDELYENGLDGWFSSTSLDLEGISAFRLG